jgi:hypothetical protein
VDPATHFAFFFIETLERSGITGGCGGGGAIYCPDDPVTRAQMAVFLERGINGADFVPPPATGTVFADVGVNDFAAAFIERLFADGITGGCGGGNYCPSNSVTRAQMAVFLLRAKYGASYTPPPATGVFNDVPLYKGESSKVGLPFLINLQCRKTTIESFEHMLLCDFPRFRS